jgi:hypothetical protein
MGALPSEPAEVSISILEGARIMSQSFLDGAKIISDSHQQDIELLKHLSYQVGRLSGQVCKLFVLLYWCCLKGKRSKLNELAKNFSFSDDEIDEMMRISGEISQHFEAASEIGTQKPSIEYPSGQESTATVETPPDESRGSGGLPDTAGESGSKPPAKRR